LRLSSSLSVALALDTCRPIARHDAERGERDDSVCGTPLSKERFAVALAEEKLNDVRAKLRDLRRIESTLTRLVGDCRAAHGTIRCPLIAALDSR
jgi:hypothetical protein